MFQNDKINVIIISVLWKNLCFSNKIRYNKYWNSKRGTTIKGQWNVRLQIENYVLQRLYVHQRERTEPIICNFNIPKCVITGDMGNHMSKKWIAYALI